MHEKCLRWPCCLPWERSSGRSILSGVCSSHAIRFSDACLRSQPSSCSCSCHGLCVALVCRSCAWPLLLLHHNECAQAISWLLSVPGASGTVLEASVPYARESLVEVLGKVRVGGCAAVRMQVQVCCAVPGSHTMLVKG